MNFLVIIALLCLVSCDKEADENIQNDNIITISTNEVLTASYFGNGVQWDPYPQAYRYWGTPISDADWATLYDRLDYMKPKFVRVVYGSYDKYAIGNPDNFNPENLVEGLAKILQYCTDNDIIVMAGDWGYNQVDASNNQVQENRVVNAVKYLDYLVNTRGFTCIKYYTTINEPNLGGSATQGNYNLWKNATALFYDEMVERGLEQKVQLAGPDVAIFNESDISWIQRAKNDFGDNMPLYDIHTYPARSTMLNGTYERLLKEYRQEMPAGFPAVVGEFGFKYETGSASRDLDLANQNQNAIRSNENIADDSNTLVNEYFHGTDLMAMTMKIINAGYAGAVNWNLDDAMHSGSTSGQDFKVWGFWNILGTEILNDPTEEELRDHFFPYALLSRYMQTGCKVLTTNVSTKGGVDVVAVEKDGKYMIAVSNMLNQEFSFKLDIDRNLSGMKKFVYREEGRKVDEKGYPLPEEEGIEISADAEIQLDPVSFVLYTNFDY